MKKSCLALFPILFLCSSCIPTEQKKGPKPLSDKPHTDINGDHKVEYDHEAFLGEEVAAEFDALPVEESKRRLKIICEKIDTDKDGYLTYDELKKWVEHISHNYLLESIHDAFPDTDMNGDNKISWDEYKDATFGPVDDLDEIYDSEKGISYKDMIERDERRFKICDQDGDGELSNKEYMAFLHPEEFQHTADIHIQETFEDMDKNKDGVLTLEEYIDDIWPKADRAVDEEEPEWVKTEREHFHKYRDTDGDNKMSKRELGYWIAPDGYNPAAAEAQHLIHHADSDKDDKLSIDEVLENHELFVGSQATDFGEYLNRHDEF